MRWQILDTLYSPEQFFCSHLDSYSHYLEEAGEEVFAQQLNGFGDPPNYERVDVAFVLDGYGRCVAAPERWHVPPPRLRVAQVAAICSPMPWEVRKPDGSPAYDLVLSSIPAMVARARAAGCRAEYMPLAFDTRARVCGMDVARDLGCIFVGTVGPNHQRRARFLEELRDVVQVLPPVFGREYFRTLARAKVVFNVHAEWAEGAANNMRLYEAIGMGAALVSDGDTDVESYDGIVHWGPDFGTAEEARDVITELLDDPEHAHEIAHYQQAQVLTHDCYEDRIPRLLELVRWL